MALAVICWHVYHPAGSATTLALPEDTYVSSETWKVTEDVLSGQESLDTKVDGEGGPAGHWGTCDPWGSLLGTPALRSSAFTCRDPCSLQSHPDHAPWNSLPRTACLALCTLHRPLGCIPP